MGRSRCRRLCYAAVSHRTNRYRHFRESLAFCTHASHWDLWPEQPLKRERESTRDRPFLFRFFPYFWFYPDHIPQWTNAFRCRQICGRYENTFCLLAQRSLHVLMEIKCCKDCHFCHLFPSEQIPPRACCVSTEAGGILEVFFSMFTRCVVDILKTIEQQADHSLKITFGAHRGARRTFNPTPI